jgi:hypothetical protein
VPAATAASGTPGDEDKGVAAVTAIGSAARREHRELHDRMGQLLAVLDRGIGAHVLGDAHVDHARVAEIAAELGAYFLHHAFVHGQVEVVPDPAADGPVVTWR